LSDYLRDGFLILKVGPAPTFALKETLYALTAMERELLPTAVRSNLIETMESKILSHAANWQKYYRGDEEQQRLLRVYSCSDRIRYYRRFPEVIVAIARLITNLQQTEISETLLSQYCPRQYDDVRAGKLSNDPKESVIANVRAVLSMYSNACQNGCSNHGLG